MKKFLAALSATIIAIGYALPSIAQDNSTGVQILSESKEIFREGEMLKQSADNVYLSRVDLLKEKLVSEIKKDIKSLTDQNSRAEKIVLGITTSDSLIEKKGKLFLRYTIPGNSIDFKVTTKDLAFGVGLDRGLDPSIHLRFYVTADFLLQQSGTVESIKFLNPVWDVHITECYANKLSELSVSALDLKMWGNMLETTFNPVYVNLNDISIRLNEYIENTVKANPALKKEFELDESRQLLAKMDNANNNLVFVHNFSKTGIVKRTATTNASTVEQQAKSIPVVPGTSTSASGANKKVNATNPGPKVAVPVRRN